MTADNQQEKKRAVEIDGKSYLVESLSPDVQRYIKLYEDWSDQLRVAEEEKFKLEAAIRALTIEIKTRIERGNVPPK